MFLASVVLYDLSISQSIAIDHCGGYAALHTWTQATRASMRASLAFTHLAVYIPFLSIGTKICNHGFRDQQVCNEVDELGIVSYLGTFLGNEKVVRDLMVLYVLVDDLIIVVE